MHAAHREQCRGLRRQHQNLQRNGHGLQARQHFQAIELGDADVQYDQVWWGLTDKLHGVNAIVRFTDHPVSLVLQQHPYRQAYNGMVINNKD